MIPFDFEYYKPGTIKEAVELFKILNLQGKEPLYYAGGTEIITFARRNHLFTKAVIDIKEIPECSILEFNKNGLITGAGLTLTQVAEANLFPLLTEAAKGVADHTARDKITLGGNICGRIIFREAVLPFLICDSQVVIAGMDGLKTIKINQAFNEKLRLKKGEFMVQLITDKTYTALPYISVKRTKLEKIDYPLITISALKKDNIIRAAFSGVYAYPFRSLKMENDLNNKAFSIEKRVDNAVKSLPNQVVDNIQGSAEYRIFILKNILLYVLVALGGV